MHLVAGLSWFYFILTAAPEVSIIQMGIFKFCCVVQLDYAIKHKPKFRLKCGSGYAWKFGGKKII